MNAVARAQLTFQKLAYYKNSVPPNPVFENMGEQMPGSDSSSG